MNVLYLINFAGKGGSEKYIKNLASFLGSKGHSVFFCYNIEGPLLNFMADTGVKCFHLTMKAPFDLTAAGALAEICKKEKIDIIHTQFARENYIAILSGYFGNKAKIVHTCHINTQNNFIWKLLNTAFMKKNSRIIAVCNSVKQLLITNHYPPDKITVIFNGIPYRAALPSAESSSMRRKLEIDDKRFVFVTLTRFSNEKGIFFLLKAALKLKNSGKGDFALLMAGDGDLLPKAKAFLEANKLQENVYLLGYRADAPELLAGSNCFINSSSSEALSFAILEALEAGLAVLATNVGGNPDIINSNTNCGLLVEYDDDAALAKAMEKFLTNPCLCKDLGQNGRRAVKDKFRIEDSLNNTFAVYLSALERGIP